jgi:murein DD-endopeptidase MepM/ murein hydrolase activator NlpD
VPADESGGFLHMPWPAGTNVFHLAYFDHVYPTVDSSADGNTMVMTYLGRQHVQYNTHDGHDYSFPDQLVGTPILAAAPGIAYARTQRGNGVVILHMNGYETVYWHLDRFDPRFSGLIDSSQGLWVDTGDVIGTSGATGFVVGTPHLHFEVRYRGHQVDPYGWYGPGPDPCAAYAGCLASTWLWHDSLRGQYDFTPPERGDTSSIRGERQTRPDFMREGASANRDGAPPSDPAPPPAIEEELAAFPATPTPTPAGAAAPPDTLDLDAPALIERPDLDDPTSPDPPSPTRAPALTLPTAAPTATPRALPPTVAPTAPAAPADTTPPLGTLSVNPPPDLLLYVPFAGHVLQQVGSGFPRLSGEPAFAAGRYGQSIDLPQGSSLTYPISHNVQLEAGSIGLWANIPERFPPNGINRHYLLAASAHPADEQGIYSGTLALRRDLLGPGGTARWNFWTTPQRGEAARHDLAVRDTLEPGWHHFLITWDAEAEHKALYIDGDLVAETDGAVLPQHVGALLELGRWPAGGSQSGMLLDELVVFGRALEAREVAALARAERPMPASASTALSRTVRLDTNAYDAESGLGAVVLGRDGMTVAPLDYYDGYDWMLPARELTHTLTVSYTDRAGNPTTLTQTIQLDLPPRGTAVFSASSNLTATVVLSVTDSHPPVQVQLSADPAFEDVAWEPFEPRAVWRRALANDTRGVLPELYVRFRDANGNVSAAQRVAAPPQPVYLPLVPR